MDSQTVIQEIHNLIFYIFRIRSDHNMDNSTDMVRQWLSATEHLYNYVDFVYDDEDTGLWTMYMDLKNVCHSHRFVSNF